MFVTFVTTIFYDLRFDELRFMITEIGTDYTLVKTSDGFVIRIILCSTNHFFKEVSATIRWF